ncbi:MAG: OmcA/MtrC family decaheme c-type cytochrome [Rubrivivax sp.]|nr:OmcA/MtrC family decaheme c-type cytochrome [Rubrivivax sp.]
MNLAFMTAEQWEAAQFTATVNSVAIASPPVVEFTIVDEQGRAVEGLDQYKSTASGATISSYPNISFAIAKLLPRTDAQPATWVSYIVTNVNATTGALTATRPTTDNQGTLAAVAGQAGRYRYTFRRDVPGTKAVIDGLAYSGNNRKEDLGDLTWTPTLPHRLTIQIGGAARGTGSNTTNGVQVAPAVNMANAVNVTYDFVPATGQVLTPADLTREDVSIANCNVCHQKLAFHGGSARVEVRYCVVCHTDQRAYGRAKATSTATAAAISFPALTETKTVDAITGITSYSYNPSTEIADNEVAGNFVTLIHKIHQGHTLVKQNYHYAGLAFNNKGFSKLGEGQKMCTTCHGGTAAATAENHREIPSRKSCGACHDGIKWDTGTGSTLADKMRVVYATDTLPSSGHAGGPTQDDSTCKSCHTADGIRIVHRTENITRHNPTILDGLASFRYEIKSAAVNAGTNTLTIEFGVWQKVAPSSTESLVTFVAPAASVSNPLAGFTGGPSFLLPYAMTQDGITTPSDYNNMGPGRTSAQPRSVSIGNLLSTNNAANGSVVPSVTNPGYYTATLLGSGAWAYPVGAKMRAVALQGYFSQITAPASPSAANGRHAISVIQGVAGDAVRRKIVEPDKCAGCHEWFEGHGGNRVYETQVCTACHVPGLATSGRGIEDAASGTFPGLANWTFDIASTKIITDWGFNKALPSAALRFPVTTNNLKDMIHGIHAGRDRVTPFQDARNRTSTTGAGGGVIQLLDFRRMDFPGKLNNCEGCHVTATGATTTYNTVPAGALASTYESIDAAYAAGILAANATPTMARSSLNQPNLTDTVTTPWAGACVSCHDRSAAKAHIAINGGQISVARSTALPAGRALEDVESCAVCHGPGRDFDTAKVHK